MRFLLVVLALLLLTPGGPLRAASRAVPENVVETRLKWAQRVLFLGDSITYAGDYVDELEVFLRRNYAKARLEVMDLGINGETVSGLSEPGHAGGLFLRPDLHERLDRVLNSTNPEIVFACYGMNDGLYLPYNEERARKFQEGMRRLHEQVTARKAVLVHITPPLFDPGPIPQKISRDGVGGFYAGYDEVLAKYSAWLVEQRAAGWYVVDLHSAMRERLAREHEAKPDFTLAPDGIHPSHEGHLFIASTIIAGLGLDATIAQARGTLGRATEAAELVKRRRRLMSDAWLTATGHKRPDMPRGLSLNEAQRQANELEKQINVALDVR